MPIYLCKNTLSRSPKIEIDRAEKDRITDAWNSILAIYSIEGAWDCVVQNYLELEMELLKSAMQSMVVRSESYDQFQQNRLSYARRLSNLLTTCRAYLDHTNKSLNSLSKTMGLHFKRQKTAAYDTNFEYRFMYELRNYSQHYSTSVHSASLQYTVVGDVNAETIAKALMRYSAAATIDRSEIQKDQKIAAALEEFKRDDESFDVAQLAREYLEVLGGIHAELRKELGPSLVDWKKIVRDAIKQYADENDGNVVGLAVIEITKSGRLVSEMQIFDDLVVRIEKMMRRNGSLVNLRRRYVTNEISPSKKVRTKKKA